jgi:NhaP-type Na+/H+ or K+/H+ antiporter
MSIAEQNFYLVLIGSILGVLLGLLLVWLISRNGKG